MPKRERSYEPGLSLEPELRQFLLRWFSPSDVERFEGLGGKLIISLATLKNKTDKDFDAAAFAEALHRFKGSEDELRGMLRPLTAKQLLEVCRKLELPVQSKMRSRELQSAIASFLMGPRTWARIAGSATVGE